MSNDPAMIRLDYVRKELDYYPTPDWVTEAVIPFLHDHKVLPRHSVWEPACGEGHMAEVFRKAGFVVTATDIKDYGYQYMNGVSDFLAPRLHAVSCIVTNPPYGNIAEQFVTQALDYTQPCGGVVAMLMRNEFDSAKTRIDLFRQYPFARKVVLTSRPRWIDGSTGAPRHNYAWFIWDWCWHEAPVLSYHLKKGK